MIPKLNQFGCQIESKLSPTGINKSMFFWLGLRMPLETLIVLRVGRDCSRRCHSFSSRPPRAAAYYQRILYKNKQRQHSLQDLARLGPLARRIIFADGEWRTNPQTIDCENCSRFWDSQRTPPRRRSHGRLGSARDRAVGPRDRHRR